MRSAVTAACSVRVSAAMASSVLATSWNAPSTVARYCAAAWSNEARAAASLCLSAPPSNTGCVTLAARVQNSDDDLNSCDSVYADEP